MGLRFSAFTLVAIALSACESREPSAQSAETSTAPPAESAVASASASAPLAQPGPGCRTAGARMISPARWSPAERRELQKMLDQGTPVLSIDECKGLRLLPRCKVEAPYGYLGIQRRARRTPLRTEKERSVNAPLLGGGKEASSEAIQLDVVTVGFWGTPLKHVLPSELVGECDGATHFVTTIELGSATAGPPVTSPVAVPDACKKTKPLDGEPSSGCNEIVYLRAEPIREREGLVDVHQAARRDAAVELGVCPAGMVISAERCTEPPTDDPYLCRLGDLAECTTQCEKGSVDSCDFLGAMHAGGIRVKRDMKAAERAYMKSCDASDGIACNALGMLWATGELGTIDRKKAADFYERACHIGEVASCANLAELLLEGQGRPRAVDAGLSLLHRACEMGQGCERYARALAEGDGGPPNVPRALAVLRATCLLHYGPSCATLGSLHYHGQYASEDRAKAATYFDQACLDGEAPACVELGAQYFQGDGVKEDVVRAIALFRKACESNDARGCVNVGVAYNTGTGVSQDASKAAEMFERSCDAHGAAACSYLADMLRDGVGVKKDAARAKALYRESCKLGYEAACSQR